MNRLIPYSHKHINFNSIQSLKLGINTLTQMETYVHYIYVYKTDKNIASFNIIFQFAGEKCENKNKNNNKTDKNTSF